ncbi:MAG TPA: phosphatase PAP2 family protein [Parafilimonas sp.]|nr:phosphatase PAP2 family protein [Parafilimonas sp.]
MFQTLLHNKTKLCWVFLLTGFHAQAQYFDSSYKPPKPKYDNEYFHLRELYLPASFIAFASYSNNEESFLSNAKIKAERNEDFPHFKVSIDNYMQFAPILAGYGCLAMGSKQNAWLYTKEVLLNEVILNISVYSVKHLSKVPSIVNGSYNAFPSGHTAQAFSAATLFSDNFAKGKPWLQCLSYGSASAVGVLRVLNERHWATDVVAGVGFGILSAKISEWTFVPHFNKKHHQTNL